MYIAQGLSMYPDIRSWLLCNRSGLLVSGSKERYGGL